MNNTENHKGNNQSGNGYSRRDFITQSAYLAGGLVLDVNGDKAMFVGQNILDARIWGSRNNWRLHQTTQLEKRDSKWIILKSVATTF